MVRIGWLIVCAHVHVMYSTNLYNVHVHIIYQLLNTRLKTLVLLVPKLDDEETAQDD